MAVTITAAQLSSLGRAPAARLELLASSFNALSARFGLDVEKRAEQFWAQWAHESGGFRYLREIWGPTAAQRRYEGRRDLGNTQPGDGKRFMGRAIPQLTGRANYRDFSKWARANGYPEAPDFTERPEVLEQFPWALLAAVWFWHSRGLNALADRDDLLGITKRINGGTNGLADRKVRLALAQKAITDGTPMPLAPVPVNDNAGRPTLRRGTKQSAAVYTLQKLLGIASDGKFGPGTEAAVLTFQRERGLLPDGVVGPGTWRALDGVRAAA